MSFIRFSVGLFIDSDGFNGGLAQFWATYDIVSLQSFSFDNIDVFHSSYSQTS